MLTVFDTIPKAMGVGHGGLDLVPENAPMVHSEELMDWWTWAGEQLDTQF